MGRKRNNWSKYRWRPGMPDDPSLWKFDGKKMVADPAAEPRELPETARTAEVWALVGPPPTAAPLRWT